MGRHVQPKLTTAEGAAKNHQRQRQDHVRERILHPRRLPALFDRVEELNNVVFGGLIILPGPHLQDPATRR